MDIVGHSRLPDFQMEEQREVLNSLQSVVSCLKHFPDVNNCGNLRGVPVITGNFRSRSVPSN